MPTIIRRRFKLPQDLLLLTAVLLLISSFFLGDNVIDIHLHDTLFVISTSYFTRGVAIIILFVWILYKLTNRFLWKSYLSWIHVLTTIFIVVLFVTAEFWHPIILPPIKREFSSWQTLQEDQNRAMKVYLPIIILFVGGQLTYIVNLLTGFVKRSF
jgi:hypothetical protein